ncbi:hypothetical protein NIES2100_71700 [Calothrix sp. NIES-2100]|uniref:hypothetical protein n=1 Tax=Calothrix sp. NIES-2100 TaxID=1954172 RepID=UPI000B6061C9|nr:hypothetical protein NIES2100_71700 [Calothrix sp. NIES-2100]
MSEANTEYQALLDEMIRTGKLKPEYKEILLEIGEMGNKACNLGLIDGLSWREDANNVIIDQYEILIQHNNFLYLTFAETRDYLKNLIAGAEIEQLEKV